MIIECPHCSTRFRLDSAQLSDSRSMLKCARCGRVFPAPGQSPPTRSRPKPQSRDQNLSFAFDDDDDDEWRAPDLAPEDVSEERFGLNASDADEPDPPPRTTSLRSGVVANETSSIGPDPMPAAPPAARSARPRPPQRDVELVRDDDDFDIDDTTADDDRAYARQGGGISVRSVFVFLALIVCGYGALTWTLLDDPDWAGRLTQTLPVIGKEARERTVGQDVALVDVSGRYERTKEGRLVFVVTGKAVNHSAESLRGVQIVSRLYGPADKPLDEQVTACGNPMEANIGDLSIHQAAILRGIKPPPEFTVQPGGQCPFVAIFLEVSGAVGTFSTEVVRARRQA
jgi:predicted Zn finger-like uncharacterized protein